MTLRSYMHIATVMLLFLTISSAAEPAAISATQLTIRLFSTQDLHKITLTPSADDDWMQTCPQCPKQPIKTSMQIEDIKDGIRLASGPPAKHLHLSGAFTVKANGSEQNVTAAGEWEITPSQSGLRLLLTLPSERYVIAALSGEASPDEPIESLKAMAVAMRTFVLVNAHRHAAEGFGLCDSTHCQALRFGKIRPEVLQAVRETAGETLWFNRQRAHIYYTQHCGGVTEAASSVWPNERAAYLSSHPDPYCLRRSTAAWNTQINLDQLNAIFHQQGWHIPMRPDDIHIAARTSSGRVKTLEVSGPEGHTAISASSFRFAVDRALGWNQIRSDWYTIRVAQKIVYIEGKGYGHGVGLCQAGAYQMAVEGHDYRQILSFYFPGTVTRISPTDTGWKSIQGAGILLLSITSSPELLQQANAAWAKANSIFPVHPAPRPTVHVLPTTELFRQTTSQPGWVLATTRGNDIYLQPPSVLTQRDQSHNVLLHEFLHILTEHEANPQTPLWLREGLAEVLAEDNPHSTSGDEKLISAGEINYALAHPTDLASSQRAHIAAGKLTGRLIKQFGISTVRGWLHNGVPPAVMRSLIQPGD